MRGVLPKKTDRLARFVLDNQPELKQNVCDPHAYFLPILQVTGDMLGPVGTTACHPPALAIAGLLFTALGAAKQALQDDEGVDGSLLLTLRHHDKVCVRMCVGRLDA